MVQPFTSPSCHDHGEDDFHLEEAGTALDVVDDPAALRHHRGHGGEIGIHQHDLGDLAGHLAAGGQGDGAVRLLQGQHVVHAVAGHGHGVALLLESQDQLALLLRGDPAEDHAVPGGVGQGLVVQQGPGVHVPLRAGDPGPAGHLRHRQRAVSGDHPHGHSLPGKITEGVRRLRPDLVGQQDQCHRHFGGAYSRKRSAPGIAGGSGTKCQKGSFSQFSTHNSLLPSP